MVFYFSQKPLHPPNRHLAVRIYSYAVDAPVKRRVNARLRTAVFDAIFDTVAKLGDA